MKSKKEEEPFTYTFATGRTITVYPDGSFEELRPKRSFDEEISQLEKPEVQQCQSA